MSPHFRVHFFSIASGGDGGMRGMVPNHALVREEGGISEGAAGAGVGERSTEPRHVRLV